MDGLGRIAGAPAVMAGVRFLVLPLTLYRLGIIEQYLLPPKANPLQAVLPELWKLQGRAAERLWEKAEEDTRRDRSCRVVTAGEIQDWLLEEEGTAFAAWLCLRPRVSYRKAARLVQDDEFASAFRERLFAASGMDLLSQMDWPEATGIRARIARDKPIPWKRLCRMFSEQYGWDPIQIGRLTLYHVKLYSAAESELGGTASVSPIAFQQRRAMGG